MKEKRENAIFFLFKMLWKYSGGSHHMVLLYMSMSIAAEAVAVGVSPFLWAHIMNTVQSSGVTWENIRFLLALLVSTFIARAIFWMLHGPSRLIENANAYSVKASYKEMLLKGVMLLPLEWHSDHHSGDTFDKIEKGAHAIEDFAGETFQILHALVKLFLALAVVTSLSTSEGLVVVVFVLLGAFTTIKFDWKLIPQYKQLAHAENSISESVFDAISNITTVVILRVERLVHSAIKTSIWKPYALVKENNLLNEVKWCLVSLECTLMTIVVVAMYLYSHLSAEGTVKIGELYLLTNYLDSISELFFNFAGMFGNIVKRAARVANSEELVKDFRSESFSNHVLAPDWKVLTIRDLLFGYNTRSDFLAALPR
ncbi:MAG: ABC transporter ATP-binding protein [Candidatus Vogelbacteria bacterium]|nr:ABC transporter ATP-binding protein [Candidatus Vogelbacteria bacterium]